ncbi:ABC transporter substrate-binding protein [Paenibacillaceae bacterium WGS1546]|uniref:ABC transporter substrate-binding protein n=1 Tax=Cohnella sp. WGS1546 TaxID=3366810 RepID=UPI00372D29D0
MSAASEKYLMLLNYYGSRAVVGEEIETTTEEVSQALYCTDRNAKLIVRRLVEESLIRWHAGRGRGNLSRIVFLAEKEPFLVGKARELSGKGEYKQAFELLREYGAEAATIERFVHWLNDHFGYDSEATGDREPTDTLRFPVFCPMRTIDPAHVYYAFDAHLARQVFDRLVEYDADAGKITPGLAHYWEANAERTEWTFYLRKGIRFHHGRELQPEDVRYTFERLRGKGLPSSWLVRNVKRVEGVGARALRVSLERPNAIFPLFASSSGMSILPRDLLQEDEARFWTKPVGTGPFRAAQWSGDGCELVANPDYFQGRAHLDRVLVAVMPEETAKLSESAQWRQLLLTRKAPDRNEKTGWNKLEALCRGSMLMTWNRVKDGPQRSEDFRRAFGLFLNRKKMIRELGEDRAYPSRAFRPTVQTPYLNEELNEKEARRLLARSGYNGEELVLCTYSTHLSDARWIEKRCAEFGVNVRVVLETHGAAHNAEVLANVDAMLFCLVFAVEDVCEIENYEQEGNFMREHLHPDIRRWVSERIDELLTYDDPLARRAALERIEHRLREESHVTFVLHKKLNTYVHPSVKGVGLNSFGFIDFKEIWLENRLPAETETAEDDPEVPAATL